MKSKDLNFEYIEDFADYIVERVENDEELFISVVGKFEEIKNIVKEMMVISEVDFDSVCLCSPEVNGYDGEYVLDCWYQDGIVWIGCEPAKRDGQYLNLIGDETYLLENVSSKVISSCGSPKVYFVNFDEACDCDEGCDACCSCECHDDVQVKCSVDNDGTIHGFTANKNNGNGKYSFTYHTTNSLGEKEIISMLKEFGF